MLPKTDVYKKTHFYHYLNKWSKNWFYGFNSVLNWHWMWKRMAESKNWQILFIASNQVCTFFFIMSTVKWSNHYDRVWRKHLIFHSSKKVQRTLYSWKELKDLTLSKTSGKDQNLFLQCSYSLWRNPKWIKSFSVLCITDLNNALLI